ncbi:hypothetical protein LWS67_19035 [Bacillus atrophaeus]|uniref:hypothetical protein n=1 Tax=Bacillus atrophaeus TaxID=1452 RepID=UPI001EFB8107|nr:hypothetical protein [Bacillus atrophaeus]MCG8398597.1 hypothetical protein [Bacillus atrophaeus]
MGSRRKTRYHVINGERKKDFHPDYVYFKSIRIKQLSMEYRSDVVEVIITSCGEEDAVYSGYSKLDG